MSAASVQTSELQHRVDHCPACGSDSSNARQAWRFINKRGDTEWVRCPECRAYYMDREYDLNNEVAHTQNMSWGAAEIGERQNNFKKRMYQSILEQLCRHIEPQGKTLLDVGCSYGGFLTAAAGFGFRVFGIDIVPEAVANVQSLGMQAQCCGNVQDFSLVQEQLDVISVLDANNYWPSQPDQLRAIYDRLKPSGLLVMRIVDKSWLATIGTILQHVAPEHGQKLLKRAVNDHRFSMPLSSMLEVMERAGFRVISATPRGAVHSENTSALVKASFAVGAALWHTTGVFMAPGAVILAERPE